MSTELSWASAKDQVVVKAFLDFSGYFLGESKYALHPSSAVDPVIGANSHFRGRHIFILHHIKVTSSNKGSHKWVRADPNALQTNVLPWER